MGRGFDAMRATYWTHEFPPHAHGTFVIEAIEAGVDEFVCDGQRRAGPGDVVVIAPGQVHTGRPGPDGPLSYRSLYPCGDLLADVVEQLHGRRWKPRFDSPVIRDPALARSVLRLHRHLEQPRDRLRLEIDLLAVMVQLIRRHSLSPSDPPVTRPEVQAVGRALALLHDETAATTSLEALAAAAGLSPYHLLRVFKLQTGLPPHQYLLNLRLERGRDLLRAGRDIAAVAACTGFADQSHFTRAFRRFFGVTPGRYSTARSFKTA